MTTREAPPDGTRPPRARPAGAPTEDRAPSRLAETRRDTVRYLYWLFRTAPRWLSMMQVHMLTGLARLAYWFPGNKLRRACEDVAQLAAASASRRSARQIYGGLLDQFIATSAAFIDVVREGPQAVDRHAALTPESVSFMRGLLERHGSFCLGVPHNVAGILFSIRLTRELPTLVLMKNSNSEARDRTSLDFARRVGVDAFMTRSVSPLGLFRACLKGARKGQLLVATVDNIDPGRKSQAHARVFGQRIAFTPWAVRISQQAKIPLVPGWITWQDGRFVLQHGDPWLGDDIEDGVQHYMSYFERRILDDPSSWLFIGHRRWARVLNRAVGSAVDQN